MPRKATVSRKTTKTKRKKTPKPKQDDRAKVKEIRSAIYKLDDGRSLAVFPESLLRHREAMRPLNVLRRAGVPKPKRIWDRWKEMFQAHPWLPQVLYNRDKSPATICLVLPHERYKLARADNQFNLEPEMLAFRNATSVLATSEWTGENINHWLEHYKDVPWVHAWLRYYDDVPAGIHVASATDVAICRHAWNYNAILKKTKPKISPNAYGDWLEMLPSDNPYGWRRWLYGGPVPPGWHVIAEQVVMLRDRLSPAGIEAAGGPVIETQRQYLDNPQIAVTLPDAMQAATWFDEVSRFQNYLLNNSAPWQRLHKKYAGKGNTGKAAFAKLVSVAFRWGRAIQWKTACEDVGLSQQRWNDYKVDCRKIGGDQLKKALIDFVSTNRPRADLAGVVVPGLFRSSTTMSRFREAASNLWAEHIVSRVERSMSPELFRQWFMDWTTPKQRQAHLRGVARRISTAQITTSNLAAEASPVIERVDSDSTPEILDVPKTEGASDGQMQLSAVATTPADEIAGRRPKWDRDHLFLDWYEDESDPDTYHSYAGIRNKWNQLNPEDPISLETEDKGRQVVKKAIQRAREERG